jgi:hypothetical protein
MGNEQNELVVEMKTLADTDLTDLAEVAQRLRAEVLHLDADAVSP